jgi:acyl-CoA reductase-like NAD-dependent aldehyde dehydrogenase
MPDMSQLPPEAASAETRAFLNAKHRLLIGGEWTESVTGDRLEVTNPALGSTLTDVAAAAPDDIDAAVGAARTAFSSGPWATMSPTRRSELLLALADAVEAHSAILTELEILDNGMPRNPAGMLAGPGAAKTLRYYAGWPSRIEGKTLPADTRPDAKGPALTYTRREPVGVVGQIVPWNYPLGMAVMKLGPALATGCTVVLKPDEKTPLSALLLGKLISEAGIPDGVVNIVPGIGDTAGAAIAAHPGIDKVAFTGSTETGRSVLRAAAGNLKRVSLELGGKSPFVVFPDADVDAAMDAGARYAFFLQGQNCQCASRIFVHDDIYEQFCAGLVARARDMSIGPGWLAETRLGPLISEAHRERVAGFVASGLAQGAQLLTGGQVLEGPGYFMSPGVFSGTDRDMTIVREEIFGPVTCVQRFGDEDLAAIAEQANDTSYGLVASVWTRDLQVAHKMSAMIRAGVVGVNHHGGGDVIAPFGGYKESGWGREFGAESLDLYLETKTVVVRYE